MLVTQHNVFFMNELMTSIRHAIREGTLDQEEDRWLAPGLRCRDVQVPSEAGGEGGDDDVVSTRSGEGHPDVEGVHPTYEQNRKL